MAESNVTIKIDIDANTNGIEDVRAKLASLALQAEAVDKQFNSISDNSSKLNKNFVDLDKEVKQKDKDFGNMSKSVDKSGKSLKKHAEESKGLEKTLRKLAKGLESVVKFGLKAVAISASAAALSLVGVSAAFKLGAAMARGYHKVMAGLFQLFTTAGAAAITVLSLFAAGQREAAAATQASRYGGGVAGLNNSTAAMRSLTSNTRLAVLGTEALQGAFMGISKSTRMTGMMSQAVTAVGDFAAASSDPKKAMAAAGDFLGQLQKGGKLTSAIVASAAAVGPEFEKAVKDAQKRGLNSAPEFLKALVGGDLSGDVAGQLDVVNNTLFGTAKRNFQMIKEQFADFGTPFLGTGTKVIGELARIVTRTFMSISGVVNGFAQGSASDKLVNAVSKMGFWITKVFNEYLPKTGSIFRSIHLWIDKMRENFSSVVNKLRPLLVGGQVLLDTFGPVVSGFFKSFGGGVQDLNGVLVDNKEGLAGFFSSFMKLFDQFAKISGVIKKLFIEALPAIRPIIDGLTFIAKALADVIAGLSKVSLGGIGSLAMLIGSGIGLHALGEYGEKKTGTKAKGVTGKIKAAVGPTNKLAQASSPLVGTAGAASSLGVTNMTAATVNLYATNVMSGGTAFGKPLQPGSALPPPAPGVQPVPGMPTPGMPMEPTQLGRMQRLKNWGGSPMGLTAAALLSSYSSQFLNQHGVGTGQAGLIGSAYFGARAMGMPKGLKIPGGSGLGLGQVAAIAAASSAVGSFASNRALDTKIGKNMSQGTHTVSGIGAGAVAGGLTGAAMGAAMTAWLGPGAGVGAAVGGAIGTVVGGISGWVNSGKFKKQAKDQAKTFVGRYSDATDEALQNGDVAGVKEAMKLMDQRWKSEAAGSKQTAAFTEEYKKQRKELEGKTGPALKAYDYNVKMLTMSTGKSASEVKELADKLGINLMGKLKDVKNVISEITGLPEFKKPSDVTAFALGQYSDVITQQLQGVIDKEDAMNAVYQAGMNIEQIGKAGGVPTDSELAKFMQDAIAYDLSQGKSAGESLGSLQSGLGKGGSMYYENSQFAGMEGTIGTQFQKLIGNTLTGLVTSKNEAGTLNVQALIAKTLENVPNADIGASTKKFVDLFNSTVDPKEKIEKWRKLVADAEKATETPFKASQIVNAGEKFGKGVDYALRAALTRIQGYLVKGGSTIGSRPGGYREPATNPVGTFTPPGTFTIPGITVDISGKPVATGGDTSTPRRNMLNANRVHNAINNTISGTRTITSAFRTNNLGSINSDHVTGRALDITGQYLGSYATAMNNAGGFAEFHGAGGDRHLHVVPPDNGPIGDTMSPLPSMSMGNAGNSYANSYSFNIASSPNASADQIAQAVMDRLHREQRSARERQ